MEWIYNIGFTAFIGSVITGLGFLIKYLIQRKINNYFDIKLADHQKELADMTEKAKYDISRKLFDFEAYAIKKHTIYPELYQRLFKIQQQFIKFNENTKRFIFIKESDKKDEFFLREIDQLEVTIINAEDYFNENELFLSKNVTSNYIETMSVIKELSSSYITYYYNTQTLLGDFSEKTEKIDSKIILLKEAIYKELSYSHFEETEEKV
ncbi:hypothetical protein L8956_04095 [Peribacillus frigoritolerans]|uniref:hypothetical protein n=1 Tax=Peribacillus frigoritolerans TaxID=450367 RepID=UPI001EFEB80E|nr:hypothetical protein [Peribacillus frigoritolerans]ULM97919.1 hypothetical protein L8956_04095 [Peribacillus frigoritolerans]